MGTRPANLFPHPFLQTFDKFALDTTAIIKENKRIGTATIARFDFKTEEGEQILVNTAISGVSMEGAAKTCKPKYPKNDFDKYLAETKANWNRQLGKITVKGDNENDKVNFYTALYHSMIAPDHLQRRRRSLLRSRQKGTPERWLGKLQYFSLWDTYRAAHPLFTYTEPERVNDMVKSFIAFFEQNGRLPVWNFYGSETDMMIGYHAVPVIVDAYLKGIGDF